MLRDDGVRARVIKRSYIQFVYEVFLSYVNKLCQEQISFLREKSLDNDVFGALIFGNNNKALTVSRYSIRLNSFVLILLKRLGEM